MDTNNLVQIIISLSHSLGPILHLISGMAYILGILFVMMGISKFYASSGAPRGRGGENAFVPMAYVVGGVVLLYTPSTFQSLSATVFGAESPLQYASLNPVNIVSAIILLIQTAGLVWFVRGCVLLIVSSQPGVQEGPKGMVFIIAGILAMNFETTAAVLSTLLTSLEGLF